MISYDQLSIYYTLNGTKNAPIKQTSRYNQTKQYYNEKAFQSKANRPLSRRWGKSEKVWTCPGGGSLYGDVRVWYVICDCPMASQAVVTLGTPCEQNDWRARLKTLPSHNFDGRR